MLPECSEMNSLGWTLGAVAARALVWMRTRAFLRGLGISFLGRRTSFARLALTHFVTYGAGACTGSTGSTAHL